MRIDPSQRPGVGLFGGLLLLCRQAMVLSCHTPCSHVVKNTLWSKEETNNVPTDKTEQVTLGVKQISAFKCSLFFTEIQTINAILWLFNVT